MLGNITSLYYNTVFCVVLAYSIQNTLKKSMISQFRYHLLSLAIIIVALLILIFTHNIGAGISGLCGYKLTSGESIGRFIIEFIIAITCFVAMGKFKSKIPKNSYFQKQSLFGFYFYYMGLFSSLQLLSTTSEIVGDIMCRFNTPVSDNTIKILFTVGNCLDILLAYVIFSLRISHPILQIKLKKIFKIYKKIDNNEIEMVTNDNQRND